MSIVSNGGNVVELFGDCHNEKPSDDPLKQGESEKFGDLSHSVPKKDHDTPPNTEHWGDDVSFGELKKLLPGEWQSYKNMRYDRCGKGGYILSPEFSDFRKFMNIRGRKPGPDYTIDRIDPTNPEYSAANTRWASKQLQAENKSSVRYLTDDSGLSLPVSEWSRRTGVSRTTILQRLRYKWTEHDAVHTRTGSRRSKSRSFRRSQDSLDRRFYQVLRWFPHKVGRNSELSRRVMRQYRQEYPEDFQPDGDGYVREHDVLFNTAVSLFYRQLWSEYRNVQANADSTVVPDTPALDYLTGGDHDLDR